MYSTGIRRHNLPPSSLLAVPPQTPDRQPVASDAAVAGQPASGCQPVRRLRGRQRRHGALRRRAGGGFQRRHGPADMAAGANHDAGPVSAGLPAARRAADSNLSNDATEGDMVAGTYGHNASYDPPSRRMRMPTTIAATSRPPPALRSPPAPPFWSACARTRYRNVPNSLDNSRASVPAVRRCRSCLAAAA